ncbi:chloride channel protein [Flavobacterium sp. MAH-1]|uniref:Chloride channel protein n=1 Tax=Flavobacterium agri TaxID=2743471 RepID=A0A7Y9C6M4_9FLAO|nr:chloride channel protein [Flavobacterium agri]NUY80493.1 chloride channel protein [Flavobacterium agri]NYA70518.1 chloride channel protein [Flavobacterium agri]
MLKTYLRKINALLLYVKKRLSAKQFIFLASVIVSVTVAFAVIVLKAFAHAVFSFATYLNSILHLSFINSILPVIGILLTVLVVRKLLGGSIEKGTSQILYAVARKSSLIPRKQMYAQIVTSSLTVGLGGSAGLESPIVVTGAAYGSNFAQQFLLSYKERTLLIGCGVAAGIAAAFNAPIAGVLFAVEVLLVDVSIAAFTPIMIAAATGALVSAIVLKENVLLTFSEKQTFDYHNIPFYILLGLSTGMVAVFYYRNFLRAEHYFGGLAFGAYRKAFFGAILLAGLIFVFPTLFGEGYESIKELAGKDPGRLLDNTLFSDWRNNNWVLLLFVGATFAMKAFATGITLGSGGNGGNFAPSLFMGSYVGFFFSKLLNLTGLTDLPVSNFTMVGMAGILSGLFHAPLTAIFLIAEITGGYDLMIPLMIVASISYALSKRFEKHSLDVKGLAKKRQAFTSNKDTNILWTLETEDIVRKNYKTVLPGDSIQKLADIIIHSNQDVFAVVDENRKLEGMIYFNDVREIVFDSVNNPDVFARGIMSEPLQVVYRSDSMDRVMEKFEQTKRVFLAVIDDGRYYGIIAKTDALEAYREQLRAMAFE